jgi:heme-degrading monooxygenase HmoA
MIVRSWRGRTPQNRAESYARHFLYVVLPKLQSLSGFAGGTILRRAVGDETEFLVLTSWESMDAVKLFAGDTPDVAVVDDDARALLSTFDTTVDHWSST